MIKTNFSIKAKIAYTIKINITQGQLDEFETQLTLLNPTEK